MLLIVEDEEGNYEPIGEACSIAEAEEIIASVMRGKLSALESDNDPGICPYIWRGFERNASGQYADVWRVLEVERTESTC